MLYLDPPWNFKVYSLKGKSKARHPSHHYNVMTTDEIAALPVQELAAPDCVMIMWFSWPQLEDALRLIKTWGFTYKTCAFCWIKADGTQIDMFRDDIPADMTLGYWTRSNSEAALLATRGTPKRLDAGVRQAIIEPRREHSRKPDEIYSRIDRLLGGLKIELFARTRRENWLSWGNQTERFAPMSRQYPRKYRVEDHIGKRYGSRVVLGQAECRPGDGAQRWMVRCDCGDESPTGAADLINGKCQQCVSCTTAAQIGPRSRNWQGGKHTPLTHYNKFKRSAARRGLEWALQISDIDALYEAQGARCALSGIPLTFDHGDGATAGPGNASLDRIDNSKGYIAGNVHLVTKDVNMGKQTLSSEAFIAMCRAVAEANSAPDAKSLAEA